MPKYLVVKDLPVTQVVEADTEEDAIEISDTSRKIVYDTIELAISSREFEFETYTGDWYDDITVNDAD